MFRINPIRSIVRGIKIASNTTSKKLFNLDVDKDVIPNPYFYLLIFNC